MRESILDWSDRLGACIMPLELMDGGKPRIVASTSDYIYEERLKLTAAQLSLHMDRWMDRIETEGDRNRKGVLLEVAAALLLSQVRGMEVAYQGISSRTQQMDVLCHNRNAGGVLGKSPVVIAECKNWNYPVGRVEYDALYRKLGTRRGLAKLGFLIATDRIAGTVYEESLRDSTGDTLIVLVDGRTLRSIWAGQNDVTTEIENLVIRASVDQSPG